jgi:membrane associated rhomboid family serine protease
MHGSMGGGRKPATVGHAARRQAPLAYPTLNGSVAHSSFYPCALDGPCHAPLAWGVSWFTAMFMHGSRDHILGNMLFLAIFGQSS